MKADLSQISYVLDESGQKKSMVVPLTVFDENWEDICDVLLANRRLETEEFVTF